MAFVLEHVLESVSLEVAPTLKATRSTSPMRIRVASRCCTPAVYTSSWER